MEFTVVVNSRRNAQGTNTDHSPLVEDWSPSTFISLHHSGHGIKRLLSWLFNECITNNAVAHAC